MQHEPRPSQADFTLPGTDDKSIDYFDHDADIGIIGRGKTIEEAFVAAAKAMFRTMVDFRCIHPLVPVEISFVEADREIALVRWLNALIGEAQMGSLTFSDFELTRDGNEWRGHAWGERWRPDLARGTEVKGATLTMLSVSQDERGWEARCVIDV